MKIWAKCIQSHKIRSDVVREFSAARPSTREGWEGILIELCKPLDVALPVVLKKHVDDLQKFSRAVFLPQDFMEPVAFDRFEIEIFPEKKKET